jgi:hypothetical protein
MTTEQSVADALCRFGRVGGEMAHGKVLDGPIGFIARPSAIGGSAKGQPQRAQVPSREGGALLRTLFPPRHKMLHKSFTSATRARRWSLTLG